MRSVNPKHYTEKYYLTDATGYEEYKKSWGNILEPRLERIVKEIPSVANKRVLDIGCGRGEMVFWSIKNGAKIGIGIDYSAKAIKLSNQAKIHYPNKVKKKAKFILLDAKGMNFDKKSFDVIIMTEVLEHLYPEEQIELFGKISNVLSDDGFVFIHTAPSKWFNDFTYKFWCYPLSSILLIINKLLTGKSYPNLAKPDEIRTSSHLIMHVNEPDYFSLRRLFYNSGFKGSLRSTNITVSKPILSWKDKLFNFIVYLNPISFIPPFNIIWGNDFYCVLTKK